MFSCLPLKEIDTLEKSLSKRVEFSGSSESNSMYSLHHIACLVLSGTCAGREACGKDEDERDWWQDRVDEEAGNKARVHEGLR